MCKQESGCQTTLNLTTVRWEVSSSAKIAPERKKKEADIQVRALVAPPEEVCQPEMEH